MVRLTDFGHVVHHENRMANGALGAWLRGASQVRGVRGVCSVRRRWI
jgi:hypothetical protein